MTRAMQLILSHDQAVQGTTVTRACNALSTAMSVDDQARVLALLGADINESSEVAVSKADGLK